MINKKNIIGRRINTVLAKKNLKQKDLAVALSVTDNTISYFVSGKRIPNTEQIIKIANFFSVSSDYLLGLSDVMSADNNIQFIHNYTGLNEFPIMCLHNNYEILKSNKLLKKRKADIKENLEKFRNETGIEFENRIRDEVFEEMHIAYFEFLNALISSPKLFGASKYAQLYCVSKTELNKNDKEISDFGSDVAEFRYQKICLDMLNDFLNNDEFAINSENKNAND